MARYKVILAYDGSEFKGFQRQVGSRTVQGVVESALGKLGWQAGTIIAAGRTDTGVHATGQVIAFDLDWHHDPDALQAALNANLPPDVSVRLVQSTRLDFHPRYDAQVRRYHYRIYCLPVRDPLRDRYSWRVWPQPDISWLTQASERLCGKHDFAAFGTPPRKGSHTRRTIYQANWQTFGDELHFEIMGNAFLYRMVRRVVGLQVGIGLGLLPLEAVVGCLQKETSQVIQNLAPAKGLTLVEVIYKDEPGEVT